MASSGLNLSQIPALTPPAGVVPNFVNPESLAPLCQIMIWVTLPLMLVFVTLRIYVRLRISRALGTDDYFCLASAAVVVTYCGMALSFLNNPVGPHQWDIPVSKITTLFIQTAAFTIVIYAVSCMFVKSALLLLYLRVFAPNPRAGIVIWCGLIFVVVFYTISAIVTMVACIPHPGDGGWQSLASEQRCQIMDTSFAQVQGVIGAIIDIYIFLVPMSMLAGLHLSPKRKMGVYAIFLTGFLACVVSIINAVFRFWMFQNQDDTWNEVVIFTLSVAELNFGIMCACMPVMFVLFKGCAKTLLSWTTKLRSWSSRSEAPSNSNNNNNEMHQYGEINDGQLPPVPTGTLSDLKRFIRRSHRSRPADTQMTLTPSAQGEVLTYVSADYDYHAHIRQSAPGPATGLPLRTWKLSRTYDSGGLSDAPPPPPFNPS